MKQISEMLSVYINGLQPQGRVGKKSNKTLFHKKITRKSTELLNIRQLECAPLFQGTVKGKKKSISNHGRKKILIDHL